MALNGRNSGNADWGAERDRRLDRLYREAAHEAPPAHLDAPILAAARREVGTRPRSLISPLRRWHVPVSLAAVVLVSVSLVILVREEGGERILPAAVPAVGPPAERPSALPTPPAPAEAARETTPQAAAPAPPRRSPRDNATAPVDLGKLADNARPEPGPSAVSGAGVVAKPEPVAKPMQQPFTATPPVGEGRAAPAPADPVTAGGVAGALSVPSEPPVARSAAEAPQARSMARAMQTHPPEQDRLPAWHGFEKAPPQKWLARIEELRRQGRAVEAEEMLSEFKRRFPEHSLPLSSK